MVLRMIALSLTLALVLTACADDKAARLTRWEAYYAQAEKPRAYVVVEPPQGSTVPMSKLIAQSVVDQLTKRKISAVVGHNKPGTGQYFVLNGAIEENIAQARPKYPYIIRWSLSDSQGRLMSSHAEGIDGTQKEWDYGSPRLLKSIGISTAGPVAQMVLAESKTKAPLDPLRQGLIVENLTGLNTQDADLLTREVRKALRADDVQVTGDPRQASFRLGGDVEVKADGKGYDNIRIIWRVMTMDHVELGNAVQENRLRTGQMANNWPSMVLHVAKAAATGVKYVFGNRSGPVPGAKNSATGLPPKIVLPGVPGRAPPPPR